MPQPTGVPREFGNLEANLRFVDADAHLREVARVLRDGGSYLIQTPNRWPNIVFETIRWRSMKFLADHCSLHTLDQLRLRLARSGFDMRAWDIQVVNEFFREKVRKYTGVIGAAALHIVNPDRLPLTWRTNLYVQATRCEAAMAGPTESRAK